MNQSNTPASVRLTYDVGGGATREKELMVAANSRYTVVVHDANVKLTYFLASGGPVEKNLIAPARSRRTVAVNGAGEAVGPGQTVSVRVDTTHNGGVVVERAMTFAYLGAIPGYHTVLGYTR
jgi:hypothetical protein